ncbi:MAG: sigma-70 family RNA polymerase sigma factor [Pseudomonadales bacterium]|nr:sigma-70 family RNA polymerase sigma factor [Pseudomonadales bacterium]
MMSQYRQAVDQHRQRIFSFARYSLRAQEDAEDVTQEVFIKLWQHWQKIDHNKLGGWLMRVAHNAVIDHVRKHKTANNHQDDFAEVEEQPIEVDETQRLDQAAFKQQLMEAIKQLEDPFRSIIIMRDIQGLSYAEIRETLDMTESQVKVYLHRSRRKLRENKALRSLFDAFVGKPVTETASLTSSSVKATNK